MTDINRKDSPQNVHTGDALHWWWRPQRGMRQSVRPSHPPLPHRILFLIYFSSIDTQFPHNRHFMGALLLRNHFSCCCCCYLPQRIVRGQLEEEEVPRRSVGRATPVIVPSRLCHNSFVLPNQTHIVSDIKRNRLRFFCSLEWMAVLELLPSSLVCLQDIFVVPLCWSENPFPGPFFERV